MKNIKIKEITIENFKGFKNCNVIFGKVTNISSENGLGKTTIFDAYSWCIFDKDSHGNSEFEIRPVDKETGKAVDHIDIMVEVKFDIDGLEKIFKKVQKQKWGKKRGSENPTFEGNINVYEIDGFPESKKSYKEAISKIVDELVFEMLTDPTYFPNMKWKDQRKILTTLISDIQDSDVIALNEKFSVLTEMLEQRDVDGWCGRYAKAIKEHKEGIDRIPSIINELSKSIEEVDYEASQTKLDELQLRLKDVENSIEDNSKVSDEFVQVNDEILGVSSKIADLKSSQTAKHNKGINTLKEEKYSLDNSLNNVKINIKDSEDGIKALQKAIDNNNIRVEELRKEFAKIESEYTSDKSTTCPTCKQLYPEDKIEEIKKGLVERMEEIRSTGKSLNSSNDFSKKEIEKINEMLAKQTATKEELIKSISEIEAKINNYPKLDIESVEEYKQLNTRLINLKEKAQAFKTGDKEEIINRLKQEKQDIQKQINEVNKIFYEKEVIEKNKERIKELTQEQRDLAQEVANCEKMLFLLEEFTMKKSTLLSEKINEKFKLVKWKLFDIQVNGGINETCELTLDGVPYSDVNTAGKIQAGLDIINTLSKKYDVTAPTFIDNRESINVIPFTESQVINLIVSKDKELKVEVA